MKDFKYLTAYFIPISALIALWWQGTWSYSTLILAFGIIPILELFLPLDESNLSEEEVKSKSRKVFFDCLLYLNLPITYFIVGAFLFTLHTQELEPYEITGLVFSTGIIIGTCGINVAHELGHRKTKGEQLLAKLLLLPALYMHFFIEHNRGHHKYVATPEDPATARSGEIIYFFWIRSLIGSYLNAWKHEQKRLKKNELPFWSLHNEMILFSVVQLSYLGIIYFALSPRMAFIAVLIALIGMLLLETINYIEHYGLMRKRQSSGRYETVQPHHSWNANYQLGRIMLYELTRHSDHHYLANKKYQLLNHHESSPQLPLGYPASMLLALAPPLWFWVVNPKLERLK